MKRKSIWFVLSLLVVTLCLAFAACGKKSASIEGCRLDITEASLKTGDTLQLTVLDADDNAVTDVSWSSSDKAIATVTGKGLVTAVKEGTADINAKFSDGTLTCTVTVAQKFNYAFDKASLDIAVGGSDRFTLVTNPGGVYMGSRPYVFTSSNPDIATVEGGTGIVTGVGQGEAEITCLVDGDEVTAPVTVREYTVMLGEVDFEGELTIGLNDTPQFSITADPAPASIAASYSSSDNATIEVSASGRVTPHKMGSATLTVTVGHRDFTALVKVESGYTINYEEVTLVYGKTGENTKKLEVSESGTPLTSGVTFTSDNDSVAAVDEASGLITAEGVGTAKITARVSEAVFFEVEVTVKYGVVQTEVEYSDGQSYTVNLDAIDSTNETIDWIYYGSDNYIERKNGGSLLGTFSGNKEPDFSDYRVGINWTDGTTTKSSMNGRTDGITLKSGSFTVKVTKDVKYISIFTGVYHGTNTTTISCNGVVCASVTFENNGDNDKPNKNKQIIFTPDIENLIGDEMEFTVSFQVGAESSHGWADNISLVAVAIIGNEARQEAAGPSATTTFNKSSDVKAVEDKTYNISEIGTEDWVYSNNNGDTNSMVRKAGVSGIIDESGISGSWGNPRDSFAVASFTWNAADATAAPSSDKVKGFLWVNGTYSIPVHLSVGEHTVILYLSGWNSSYIIDVVDSHANTIVEATKLVEPKGDLSQAVEVKIPLNVTTADVFTVRVSRGSDSADVGNHGWAAIAVANESAIKLTKTQYDLVKDSATKDTAEIQLTDAPASLTYLSANEDVATVESGIITAVGAGNTYITISDGETTRRVFVTVTEYTLTSAAQVTLPLEADSQIVVTATPNKEFEVTYTVEAGKEDFITVSASGKIVATQKTEEPVTVTVTVVGEGITFTVTVTVVEYQISPDRSITLHAGGKLSEPETQKIELMLEGEKVNGVKFSSNNTDVAIVDLDTGVITAVGVGTAIITAEIDNVQVPCTVTVIIPDVKASDVTAVEKIMEIIDLTHASDTYKTLDYKHWRANDNPLVTMPGGPGLIGDATGDSWGDWGGTISVGYGFSATPTMGYSHLQNVGASYMRVYGNGFTVPVTVNNQVREIILFVSAWNSNVTVTYKLGDRTFEAATQKFSVPEVSGGQGRIITLALDVAKMLDGETDTLTIQVANEGGNVALYAIALAGGAEHDHALQATGTATMREITEDYEYFNLTDVGTYDWLYSHYESPSEETFRKFEGHGVFTGESYYANNGDKSDVGILWNGKAALKWTDGIRSDLANSDDAVASVNPVDNDGAWDQGATGGDNGYTNNCFVKNGEVHIGMHLAAGKYVITAYLYSKNAPIGAAIYDSNNNFVVGKQMFNDDYDGMKCFVVTYTIDVTETGDFTLVIGKVRSHDNNHREVGWQAIAVAKND